MLDTIETSLDAEFQKAVPTYLNVDITTPAGSLKFDIVSPETFALHIATRVSEYWAKAIELTGEPQSCNTIETVVNDAPKIIPIITSGLLSIYNGNVKVPSYSEFCSVIINAVKTIIWQVHESDSTCGTDFTVTVS